MFPICFSIPCPILHVSRHRAHDVLNNWYKEHPELNIETDLEDYADGSDGVFASVYEVDEPHGVGLW